MQSVIQSFALEKELKPWQKITWPINVEQGIYKAWGDYYAHRRRENIASHCYNKALNIFPNDYKALYARSRTRRRAANVESALQDSKLAARALKAVYGKESNARINLEICDCLYDANRFEDNKIELIANLKSFTGNKTKSFRDRLYVVDSNVLDVAGSSYGPFVKDHAELAQEIAEKNFKEAQVDERPLWKILQEEQKCDVLSVLEREEELVSPLEAARRKRAFEVFNQLLIYRPWVDVMFLKNLKHYPNFIIKENVESAEYLRTTLSKQYAVVLKFLKMLEARTPLYYQRKHFFPNQAMYAKYRTAYLYRVQYQTRRNMIMVLREIHTLREQGNVKKLANYIESVMGDYVVIKTNQIMPWKSEFLNDVYNILGLAYAKLYVVNEYISPDQKDILLKLLRLPRNKSTDVADYVFGDRSSYQNQSMLDPLLSSARQMITRLEKRLLFSNYKLERSYLYFTIAKCQLEQNRFDECCFIARKAIREADDCCNRLWSFLSRMLIVKAHVALKKVERAKEELDKAAEMANKLKDPYLITFVATCSWLNDEELGRRLLTRFSRGESQRSTRMSVHNLSGSTIDDTSVISNDTEKK